MAEYPAVIKKLYKYLLFLCILVLPIKYTFADGWLDRLSNCESGGRSQITILDSNNKYSYGEFQFQLETFMKYGKQYGILPDEFTNNEGLLIIHNSSVQRAIAQHMIDDGLTYHWKNCVRKLGKPASTNE